MHCNWPQFNWVKEAHNTTSVQWSATLCLDKNFTSQHVRSVTSNLNSTLLRGGQNQFLFLIRFYTIFNRAFIIQLLNTFGHMALCAAPPPPPVYLSMLKELSPRLRVGLTQTKVRGRSNPARGLGQRPSPRAGLDLPLTEVWVKTQPNKQVWLFLF